jgi:hypothetical protein
MDAHKFIIHAQVQVCFQDISTIFNGLPESRHGIFGEPDPIPAVSHNQGSLFAGKPVQ